MLKKVNSIKMILPDIHKFFNKKKIDSQKTVVWF